MPNLQNGESRVAYDARPLVYWQKLLMVVCFTAFVTGYKVFVYLYCN